MPNIDIVKGIRINIYNGDNRHPHIHAIYNEFEVLVEIETAEIYAGNLPGRQLKDVFDWLLENSDWALQVFYELNPKLK